MDYILMKEQEEFRQWLDIGREFYEAYTLFRTEGTNGRWLKFNGRDIVVTFSYVDRDNDWIEVMINCPDAEKRLYESIHLDKNANTYSNEKQIIIQIISDIYRLAFLEIFKITTATDYECEYEAIRVIMADAIKSCIHTYGRRKNVEERIVELHSRQIKIQFQTKKKGGTMPEERSYDISVHLYCITTGRSISCSVEAFDENPRELIWGIQELAWEQADPDLLFRKQCMEEMILFGERTIEVDIQVNNYCSSLIEQIRTGNSDILRGAITINDQRVDLELTRDLEVHRFNIRITMGDKDPIETGYNLFEYEPVYDDDNEYDITVFVFYLLDM